MASFHQAVSETSPNPRKTLNRQDAKLAKIPRFGLWNRKTRRPLVERQRCPSGPFLQRISLGVLGALAVQDFRIGTRYPTPSPRISPPSSQRAQREPGSEDPASDQGRKSSGLLRRRDSGTPGISGSFFAHQRRSRWYRRALRLNYTFRAQLPSTAKPDPVSRLPQRSALPRSACGCRAYCSGNRGVGDPSDLWKAHRRSGIYSPPAVSRRMPAGSMPDTH